MKKKNAEPEMGYCPFEHKAGLRRALGAGGRAQGAGRVGAELWRASRRWGAAWRAGRAGGRRTLGTGAGGWRWGMRQQAHGRAAAGARARGARAATSAWACGARAA